MSEKLDVLIFGATGFTGRYVVKDAIELLKDFRWGIAGRQKSRLEAVLQDVGKELDKDLSKVPIILADVEDEKSIIRMAEMCKVVINCCGPYQLYGEVVVKACINFGTHHIDISGEPQFINKLRERYNEMAEEKGSYIVTTCGFESLPADLGVVFADRNFDGTVNSIEMYMENFIERRDKSSRALVHDGTWASGVYSLKNSGEFISQLWQMRKEKMPQMEPKLGVRLHPHKPAFLNSYGILFPLTDYDCVKQSQRFFYKNEQKRPIQFHMYLAFRSLLNALLFQFMSLFIVLVAQVPYMLNVLLSYPHIFTAGLITKEGPSKINADAQHFAGTFNVKGWSKGTDLKMPPNKRMLVRVSGYNPFYGFTGVGMLCAAVTMLTENQKMPNRGGVLTPASAFSKTNFIEALGKHKHGIKFEVVK